VVARLAVSDLARRYAAAVDDRGFIDATETPRARRLRS
jgi:hypothetical protein